MVRGVDVALPTHYHEEDQLTFVLSGRRRFLIGKRTIEVFPGRSVRIPARTPHRSLSESTEVLCINVYTSPHTSEIFGPASDLICLFLAEAGIARSNLLLPFDGQPRTIETSVPAPAAEGIYRSRGETVSQAAQRSGMSREGFSRRFKRLAGIAPQQYRLLENLNDARRLLRSGLPIGAAAAEAGFSDQSHLGRCFRRFFGVTPRRYVAGPSD